MKGERNLSGRTQSGFLSASRIPYLLLGLALLLALFLWNALRSKNIQLAELEQVKSSEISTLEARIQKDSRSIEDLSTAHQALQSEHNILKTASMPALKRELSFAKAEVQRASHVSAARDSLQISLASAEDSNNQLKQQVQMLPALKRELSYAKAEAQRAQHVSDARDKLQSTLVSIKGSEKSADDQMEQQLQMIPELKRQLSFANAELQRAKHTSTARDKLITALASAKDSNGELQKQLQTLPVLKRELSFAKAEAQRAQHVKDARDNLQSTLASIKSTDEQLEQQAQLVPGLKRELSFANAEIHRSKHTNKARENLIGELKAMKIKNMQLELQMQEMAEPKIVPKTQSKDLAATDVVTEYTTDELVAANTAASEFEDLQLQNKYLIKRLIERLLIIYNLKKELSFANAENQRGTS